MKVILALALAMFCGWMQTDYVYDLWDAGFVVSLILALGLCVCRTDAKILKNLTR